MRERASFELTPRITVACPFRVNGICREGTRKKQQQITPTDIHCDSFRRYGDGFILISDKWHPPTIFISVGRSLQKSANGSPTRVACV